VHCSALHCDARSSALQCVAVCGSALQCVAVRCSMDKLRYPATKANRRIAPSVLQCVAMRCSVLQCVAVCCSVLQYRQAVIRGNDSRHLNCFRHKLEYSLDE